MVQLLKLYSIYKIYVDYPLKKTKLKIKKDNVEKMKVVNRRITL